MCVFFFCRMSVQNLVQNKRTLLPKIFGLFSYNNLGRNIRFMVMNNILPSHLSYYQKYDLKGSTYGRQASAKELSKSSPTLKDIDFNALHPDGLFLDADLYERLANVIRRDCLVLESFKIMDYSMLLGMHRPGKDDNVLTAKVERSRDG